MPHPICTGLKDRLGPVRINHAYAYRSLLEQNGWMPNGSDFPVESINPVYGFYAAVARKDLQGMPAGGYHKEQALTREQALKAMTIWAAKASFGEKNRGSLEPGKDADFVVLDRDIMTVPEDSIPGARVLETWIREELNDERYNSLFEVRCSLFNIIWLNKPTGTPNSRISNCRSR